MDKTKEEILLELLADKDLRETLKKILLEEPKKKTTRKPRKSTTTKTAKVTKKVAKKTPAKKKPGRPKGSKNKKITEDDPRYFITDSGEVIDLDKLKITGKPKEYRPKAQRGKERDCVCGKKFISSGGYLCDSCLRGRS